ncbi:MAG: diacylglycerol kinase family protein [Burkholderiaceae bacterium]
MTHMKYLEQTMPEAIDVIINAHAGGSYDAERATTLTQLFERAGMHVHVTLAADGAQMLAVARAAVAAGAKVVIAGGGDGTMNAVASELVGSSCALGVLPMGTLNHFAKDLGIPIAVEAAVATVAANHTTQVDTGEVNGKVFLNNSGLGMYPAIVRDREHQQHRLGRGKWLAFASAAWTTLRRYPFLTVGLAVDGKRQTYSTPFIFIGNNAYSMNGFTLGERSTLQQGVLSLYVAQRTSRLGLFRLALQSLFGRLNQAKDFRASLAQDLVIETRRRKVYVATDGEVNQMETPLHYRVRARSLRVIVPATTSGESTDRTER